MVLGIASRHRVAVVVGVLLVLLVSLCGLASTQECGSTAKPIAISEVRNESLECTRRHMPLNKQRH